MDMTKKQRNARIRAVRAMGYPQIEQELTALDQVSRICLHTLCWFEPTGMHHHLDSDNLNTFGFREKVDVFRNLLLRLEGTID